MEHESKHEYSPLVALPPELLSSLLILLDPVELGKLSQTCRSLHAVIHSPGWGLWKEVWGRLGLGRVWVTTKTKKEEEREHKSKRKQTNHHETTPKRREIDYQTFLPSLIHARTVVRNWERYQDPNSSRDDSEPDSLEKQDSSDPPRSSRQHRLLALDALLTLLVPSGTASLSNYHDKDSIKNVRWVAGLVGDRPIFQPHRHPDPEQGDEEVDLLAKLEVVLGMYPSDATTGSGTCYDAPKWKDPHALTVSRAYIYSWASYGWETEFGPFRIAVTPESSTRTAILPFSAPEGPLVTNWGHMRALRVLFAEDLEEYIRGVEVRHLLEIWLDPLNDPAPQKDPTARLNDAAARLNDATNRLNECIARLNASTARLNDATTRLNDPSLPTWAQITGPWLISFCFVDHLMLMVYNSTADFLIDSLVEAEVKRELRVWIEVTGVRRDEGAAVEKESDEEDSDEDEDTRPITKVHFAGTMSGVNSTVAGWVWRMEDGEIRWHLVCGEAGRAIWSSEGIQLGPLGPLGILGTWTTVFHDEADPVGPLWMRRDLGALDGMPTS
ncbi:hypothetical protein C8J56DRAFT_131490 [Mycena floridula]|nr:hypothetical protein C8J56DRAFT_131490 [Mycena floridula]